MIDTPEDDDWPSELSLDDHAGPAAYQSGGARDALVNDVLARAYGPAKKRWATRSIAAAALLVCIGGGSASAAVMWYVRAQREVEAPAPAPATAPKPAVVAPSQGAPAVVPEPTVAPTPEPARVRHAEDWLREGNRLRAAERWKQADEAYGNAARGAESAYVAFVASAGVRLEHLHDARGALSRYRAALHASPRGALGEEIRLGIADAYRAMGDRERERDALATFLREHPDSALAEQARARLR